MHSCFHVAYHSKLERKHVEMSYSRGGNDKKRKQNDSVLLRKKKTIKCAKDVSGVCVPKEKQAAGTDFNRIKISKIKLANITI